MPKLIPSKVDGKIAGYFFDCPGCQGGHFVTVRPFKAENGASWEFNGDCDYPTFTPSVLSRIDRTDGKPPKICHLFVRNGALDFCPDSTHALAGKTVAMVDT